MRISDTALAAIKYFEGIRLKAYRCPAGVLTIGYGHTRGVSDGEKITKAKANKLLIDDLKEVEHGVISLGAWTQPQFDALVSFAFNLGLSKLTSSTLLRLIRSGANENTVRMEFGKWVYAGGKISSGLVHRRAWEANRFFEK